MCTLSHNLRFAKLVSLIFLGQKLGEKAVLVKKERKAVTVNSAPTHSTVPPSNITHKHIKIFDSKHQGGSSSMKYAISAILVHSKHAHLPNKHELAVSGK